MLPFQLFRDPILGFFYAKYNEYIKYMPLYNHRISSWMDKYMYGIVWHLACHIEALADGDGSKDNSRYSSGSSDQNDSFSYF